MGVLVMAAQLILSLSIIVTLHELGHFLAARIFGIKVEKFYLFFDAWGFKIFKFKKGDTEYGIGWLPLGGYVKIAGMIDESMDKEALKQEPQPWEFRSKPAWQRLIVMLGGVIMNFIFGVIVFAFITLHFEKQYLPSDAIDNGIYAYDLGEEIGFKTGDKILMINGEEVERYRDVISNQTIMGATITVERDGRKVDVVISDTLYKMFMGDKKKPVPMLINATNYSFEIDSVVGESPASKAGLQAGDRFLYANEHKIHSYGDFIRYVKPAGGQEIDFVILRNNDTIHKNIVVDSNGTIGFLPSRSPYEFADYKFKDGIKYGLKDGVGVLVANWKGFGKIFAGEIKATESIQSPIGIAKLFGTEWKWRVFWYYTGLISLILGFMNLLPIPALDGGHAMFLTFEIITRRQLSERFMEIAQMVGMVILILLMVFAFGNDIWKIIMN